MKPDWKDAPEWAEYLAMDGDGEWVWFQSEPYRRGNHWLVTTGKWLKEGTAFFWKHTKEQRPK